MNKFYIWPNNSNLDVFFKFLALIFVLFLFIQIIRMIVKYRKKDKVDLLTSYCRRIGLNDYETAILRRLYKSYPMLNINNFFNVEIYFDEYTDQYLKKVKNYYYSRNNYKNLGSDLSKIKAKINFTKNVPYASMDIPTNQNVKLRFENVGFITGTVIHNDNDGLLIRTYFSNIVKKIQLREKITIYFWDDVYQYEVHSTVKKISFINLIQYILVYQGSMMIKSRNTRGFQIDTEIPVYFTHIFNLKAEDMDIKQHVFTGNINIFSMIGAEIFTKFKVVPSTLFLFEFRPLDDTAKRYHFTGKIIENKKVKKGTILFIKYIDMNEECKKYVNDLICDRLNEIK